MICFGLIISVFADSGSLSANYQPKEGFEYRCKAALAAARKMTRPKDEEKNSAALKAQIEKLLAGDRVRAEDRSRLVRLVQDLESNPDQIVFVDIRSGSDVARFISKMTTQEDSMIREDYRQGPNYASSVALMSAALMGGPWLTKALVAGAGGARFFQAATQGVDGRRLEAAMYLGLGFNLLRQGASFASFPNMVAGLGMIGASGIRFFFPSWSGAVTDAIVLGSATQVLLASNAFHLNAAVSNNSAVSLLIAASIGVAIAGPMEVLNRIRNLKSSVEISNLPDSIETRVSSGPRESVNFYYDHFDQPADSRLRAFLVAARKIYRQRPELVTAIRNGDLTVQFDQLLVEPEASGSDRSKLNGPSLFTVIRWKPTEGKKEG